MESYCCVINVLSLAKWFKVGTWHAVKRASCVLHRHTFGIRVKFTCKLEHASILLQFFLFSLES